MRKISSALVCSLLMATIANSALAVEPLRVLMITGGGYHDYNKQKIILSEGVSARANVVWEIVQQENVAPGVLPKVYENEDWAKGFDVILHNECYAKYSKKEVIDRIVKSHVDHKVGVVAIHCAMHTFRDTKTKEWDKLIGVESRRHGAKFPIVVKNLAPKHPVMKDFPSNWTSPQGELYHTTPLAETKVLGVGYKTGEEAKTSQTCIWASEYKGVRTFGVTLGHHNETVSENEYLDLIARAVLWSCDKLNDDGTPKEGYGPKK
jgi:type 1 glutamine amidotransferase